MCIFSKLERMVRSRQRCFEISEEIIDPGKANHIDTAPPRANRFWYMDGGSCCTASIDDPRLQMCCAEFQRSVCKGKNGYRLNYIRAKRADTSVARINSIFLVMSLLILLRIFFRCEKQDGQLKSAVATQWRPNLMS